MKREVGSGEKWEGESPSIEGHTWCFGHSGYSQRRLGGGRVPGASIW